MDFEFDDDDVITGRHAGISCADGGKADKVRALWGDGPIAFAAGNGSLDIAMMELADVKWSIYPNPKFEAFCTEQGWPILPRPADFVEEDKLA
jgi:phosphoserine phosphatase